MLLFLIASTTINAGGAFDTQWPYLDDVPAASLILIAALLAQGFKRNLTISVASLLQVLYVA
jgi:hypothetical protein